MRQNSLRARSFRRPSTTSLSAGAPLDPAKMWWRHPGMKKLMARVSICTRLRHAFQRQTQRVLAQKYATFLPEDLRSSLYNISHADGGPAMVTVPTAQTRLAAVLFADISGFTRLTEVSPQPHSF